MAWDLAGPGAAELARAAAEEGADRIVAIGGDGTALEVAAGLLAAERPVPMAHVPRGTANVLALNLGIPFTLAGAIRSAVGGVVTRMDVGRLATDGGTAGPEAAPFLLSVGTGLHADIVERADRRAKRRWGAMAYVWAGWRLSGVAAPVRHRLTIDGEALEVEATMIQVMNCGAMVYRRSWTMGPGITPVDGLLDVVAFRARSRGEYARVATGVVRGAPTATPLVLHRRGARIRIESDLPVRIQRDGEPAGTLPVEIGVETRALPVVVPAGSPWAEAEAGGAESAGAVGTPSAGPGRAGAAVPQGAPR